MRILIHGFNYAPELVGIGRYTGELGSWLASRGHAVTVLAAPPYYPEWRVAPEYRPQRWRRERLRGVEVLRAPLYVPGRVTGRGRVLHELSFGVSCLFWWAELGRRPWDLILAVCPPLQSGLLPSLLAGNETPLVVHFQDLQLDVARELGILRQPRLLAWLERIERWLLRRARAVTTISGAMAARIGAKGVEARRLHVLPNWADLEGITPGKRHNALRRELGMDSEVVVLYAGSMGEKQGLETVLQAAALTRGQDNVRYLLAGEGAAKSRLTAQARKMGLKNLLFLPLQSNIRYPLLLAAGDIHLVAQKQQAADLLMPSKLANIMAAGRCFIATALPETELGRITRESRAGVSVPPEAPKALAEAILQLAADVKTRNRMGRRARGYAEAQLSRDRILARWEELFQGLVGRTGNERRIP
jgi:colanic acid biosynthesis glycosyl transferase WcaI